MRLIVALAVLLLVLGASIAHAGEKVTICHATGSETNPWVEITIAKEAWESGHSPHAVHVRDYLGPCLIATPTVTPTATVTPTSAPTSTPTATPTTPTTQDMTPVPSTNTPTVTPVISSWVEPPQMPSALPNSGGAPPK